jgi:hypothetical protein
MGRVSESARATSAAEARFRVPYPNARPRSARLVALDRASEPFVAHLAHGRADRVAVPLWSGGADDRLEDAAERARQLIAGLDLTDLVVMISTGGADSPAASMIAEACRLRGVPVTVFVLDTPDRPERELSEALAHLRPYASMLVRASGQDYVEDMLTALRV